MSPGNWLFGLGVSTNAVAQGFDEFMNLVIDDAVEVHLAMKENKEEKRRQLGSLSYTIHWNSR